MNKILIISFIFCLPLISWGQTEDIKTGSIFFKVHSNFSGHIHSTLNPSSVNSIGSNSSNESFTSDLAIGISLGWYDYARHSAIGFGVGFNSIPDYEAFNRPLFLEYNYFFLKEENSPFLKFYMGWMRPSYLNRNIVIYDPLNQSLTIFGKMNSGLNPAIGIGQKKKFFNHLSAIISLDYDLKLISYSNERYFKSSRRARIQGLTLSLGILISK